MKKKLSLLLLFAMILSCLTACGGADFDASKYVTGVLEVSYKGETKNYLSMVDDTEENAKQLFEDTLDTTMDGFATDLTDETLIADYRALFADILSNISFSVAEAVETEEGNYTVDVTVEPLTIFDDIYDEYMTKVDEYTAQITEEVINGGDMPDDATINTQVYQLLYDCLKANMDSGLSYGEPVTVTLHVNKDSDGVYSIPDEDLTALDNETVIMDKY